MIRCWDAPARPRAPAIPKWAKNWRAGELGKENRERKGKERASHLNGCNTSDPKRNRFMYVALYVDSYVLY